MVWSASTLIGTTHTNCVFTFYILTLKIKKINIYKWRTKNMMSKKFYLSTGKKVEVTLNKEGYNYVVRVNGEVYKSTPNELFAVQAFISI